LQLPVRRIGRGKRSPVYASVRDLKFWMATSEAGSVHSNRQLVLFWLPRMAARQAAPRPRYAIQDSHRYSSPPRGSS